MLVIDKARISGWSGFGPCRSYGAAIQPPVEHFPQKGTTRILTWGAFAATIGWFDWFFPE
jgi:hypothetical protein